MVTRRAGAVSEFDFAFVEVFLEFLPFLVVNGSVLNCRTSVSASGEVGLVVPDDVLVEDGDVAGEGVQVQEAEKGGADMDR
jgi:hypothetical protein